MPSDAERLAKLLPHWMGHNAEHADEFRQWAERAHAIGYAAAAAAIVRAAEALLQANAELDQATRALE